VPDIDRKNIFRIMDANFNRAKEGLRVCEDVCRFFLDNKSVTRQFKDIRHELTTIFSQSVLKQIIASRDVARDVGRPSSGLEFKRKWMSDAFYANVQRVKESIRVLEEVMKLMNVRSAEKLKNIRYKVYALERKVVAQL